MQGVLDAHYKAIGETATTGSKWTTLVLVSLRAMVNVETQIRQRLAGDALAPTKEFIFATLQAITEDSPRPRTRQCDPGIVQWPRVRVRHTSLIDDLLVFQVAA